VTKNTKKQELNIDELINENDNSSRLRSPVGIIGIIITVIAVMMSLFHLVTAGLINMNVMQHRYIHYAFAVVLVFLLYPATTKNKIIKSKPTVLDWILAILSGGSAVYLYFGYESIVQKGTDFATIDIAMGTITIILLLEAARRSIGYQLPILSLIFFLYAYLGPSLPGILAHRGFSFSTLVERMYIGNDGIFGVALGVSAAYVFLFILFGAFLNGTGMSSLFTNMAIGAAGHRPGGPAKVSIIGSGTLGMINGSAIANVATTGVFTIPLMKKVGYKGKFAAGVEAVASTGGQITPPIMGSAAFVMAEFLGMPYKYVMVAAIIPAILYFVSLWFMVHLQAQKRGLAGLNKDELPSVKTELKKRGHLIIPVIILLVLLFADYTPIYSAFWAIISTYIVSLFRKETRMNLKTLINTLAEGAKGAAFIAIATAVVGIIVGVVSTTGLGLQLANVILSIAQGYLFPTLLLTMIACVVLGMGLPTTAAYIVAAIVATPAVIELGVEPIVAHMFVIYYASLSNITPPVALASYTGAGISGSNPTQVSWVALQLGAAGFLVPFIFVYSPDLLLEGSGIASLILAIITAVIGVYTLSLSIIGYWKLNIKMYNRLLLFIAALAMMHSGWLTDVIGILILLMVLLIQLKNQKQKYTEDEVSIQSN